MCHLKLNINLLNSIKIFEKQCKLKIEIIVMIVKGNYYLTVQQKVSQIEKKD